VSPAPTNVAFLGIWGIGKTSILRYIEGSKEFQRSHFINLPIIQDFDSINDLLVKALENIEVTVSKLKWLEEKVAKKIKGLGPVSFEFGANRALLTERFIEIWDILEKAGTQHCSILIDDFHVLSHEERFTIRNIFQRLPSAGCNYSLIISAPTHIFQTPISEPVSRFFYKQHLGAFTAKEIEESIWKPVDVLSINLSFDKYYVDELAKVTAGHPFFVKFITKELAKRYEKVRGKHIGDHFKDILSELGKQKFEDDYKHASAAEQDVLNFLAKTKLSGKFEAKQLKSIKNYPQYLKRLCEKGLLNLEERGVYSVYHPLFLEWIWAFHPTL